MYAFDEFQIYSAMPKFKKQATFRKHFATALPILNLNIYETVNPIWVNFADIVQWCHHIFDDHHLFWFKPVFNVCNNMKQATAKVRKILQVEAGNWNCEII